MAKESLDFRVNIGLESKEYRAVLKKCNDDAKEFKKQQRAAFKQAGTGASDSFGMIIAAAKKLAPAVSAGAAALNVAKTAMQENQRLTDEWGRITESARASYENFVNTLVSGDFSGFFSNMRAVIQSARDAYDALDALGTANIFYNKSMAESELLIRQARYTIKDENATAEERKAAGEVLQREQNKQIAEAKKMADIYMKAFAAKLSEQWTARGVKTSIDDLITTNEDGRVVTKSGSLFEKYYKDLETYNQWAALYAKEKNLRAQYEVTGVDLQTGRELRKYNKGNMSDADYEELEAVIELSDEKLKEAFDLLQKAWQTENTVLTKSIENFEYIRNANKPITSSAGSGVSAKKTYAEGSIGWMEQEISRYREQIKSATTQSAIDEANHWIQQYEREIAARLKASDNIAEGVGVGKTLSEKYGKWGEFYKLDLKPIKAGSDYTPQEDANKDVADSSEKAAEGIVMVSDALQQLGIFSGIADDGLRSVTSFIGKALGIVGSVLPGPLGKALGGVGGLIGSFDSGGIVGGTSYTGDRLVARVNSGEMILNQDQQRRLFNMANGSGSGGTGMTSATLRGEDLYFALRNYGRRTGKIHLP